MNPQSKRFFSRHRTERGNYATINFSNKTFYPTYLDLLRFYYNRKYFDFKLLKQIFIYHAEKEKEEQQRFLRSKTYFEPWMLVLDEENNNDLRLPLTNLLNILSKLFRNHSSFFSSLIFISFISIVFVDTQAQSISTTIQGNVKDADFNTPLDDVKVIGINQITPFDTLFKTETNDSGNYTAVITSTGINDDIDFPINFELAQNYPNPFNPSTKFNFNVPKSGNYVLGIYDVIGSELFKQSYNLSPGKYVFDVSGLGAAGVKFYRFIGENFSETKKMIQLDGSAFNPSVSVGIGGKQLSTLSKSNNLEIRIIAELEGYLKDTVDVSLFEGSVNTQDFLLSQIPKPIRSWRWLVQDPLDNALNPTIFLRTEEGQEYTLQPQANGVYDVSVQTNGNSVKLWWSHPDLQEIGYIMPQTKGPQDLNITQNSRVAPGSLDMMIVNDIDLLENPEYTRLKLIHNEVDGRDMTSAEAQNIVGGRRGGYTTRFMEESALGLDHIDVVIYGRDEDESLLAAVDSARIVNITQQMWNLTKNLEYQIHYITSWDTTIWQNILERNGDNAVMYRHQFGTPGNIVTYKFATNGLVRNEYGEGHATKTNSDRTWAEEIGQPIFSWYDPNTVQGLGDWIYTNGVGPTEFGEYTAALISETDNLKYQYVVTSTGTLEKVKSKKEYVKHPLTKEIDAWGNMVFHYQEN